MKHKTYGSATHCHLRLVDCTRRQRLLPFYHGQWMGYHWNSPCSVPVEVGSLFLVLRTVARRYLWTVAPLTCEFSLQCSFLVLRTAARRYLRTVAPLTCEFSLQCSFLVLRTATPCYLFEFSLLCPFSCPGPFSLWAATPVTSVKIFPQCSVELGCVRDGSSLLFTSSMELGRVRYDIPGAFHVRVEDGRSSRVWWSSAVSTMDLPYSVHHCARVHFVSLSGVSAARHFISVVVGRLGSYFVCARLSPTTSSRPAVCQTGGRRRLRRHTQAASPEQRTSPSFTHGHVHMLSGHGVLRSGGWVARFQVGQRWHRMEERSNHTTTKVAN